MGFRLVGVGSPVSTCLPIDVTYPVTTHTQAHPVHLCAELGDHPVWTGLQTLYLQNPTGRATLPPSSPERKEGPPREEQILETGSPSGRRASRDQLCCPAGSWSHAPPSPPMGTGHGCQPTLLIPSPPLAKC